MPIRAGRSRVGRAALRPGVGIEITPLIDVVFQLLLFFMLSTSFVFQTGVPVHLPQAVTSELADRENVRIGISREGSLTLDSSVVTLQELRARLKALTREREPILIQADEQASLGRVVEIWDTCRALGISRVNVATRAKSADNSDQTR